MKTAVSLLLLAFGSLQGPCLHAGARQAWVLDEKYTGSHIDSFNKLKFEVPVLIRQSTLDMAVRCGLDFQDGWSIPLTINFSDGSPLSVENALAYVQMMQDTKTGQLFQFLTVNLEAYQSYGFDFKKVFAHELVHAMLNDQMSGASMSLPVWFHEGLAVYGANQGEQLMRSILSQYPNANETLFLNGLDGPHSAIDYMEDYLAFEYIREKHGVSALHNFVRDVIAKQGDVNAALKYTLHLDRAQFDQNALSYAQQRIFDVGRDLKVRGVEKAY